MCTESTDATAVGTEVAAAGRRKTTIDERRTQAGAHKWAPWQRIQQLIDYGASVLCDNCMFDMIAIEVVAIVIVMEIMYPRT